MLAEHKIELREGTTRYVSIDCVNANTGADFDFTGYSAQTWISFGDAGKYIPVAVVESTVSFKIPASDSIGKTQGVAETRIFKDNDDVFEVIRMVINVRKASKPDITYHSAS